MRIDKVLVTRQQNEDVVTVSDSSES